MIAVYRYRVKDKHGRQLALQARAVNLAWNFCNDTQRAAVARGAQWPSHFTLFGLMKGAARDLGVLSSTLNAVAKHYVQSLRVAHRRRLRYRGRRSLGWMPLRGEAVRAEQGSGFRVGSVDYSVWKSRPLPVGAAIKDGSGFAQDACGRWFLNIVVDLPDNQRTVGAPVGVDLGLKSLATLSDGRAYKAPAIFRRQAARLAVAQRARRRRLARSIHARIAQQRRDFLHKLSTEIARSVGDVYIGNLRPRGLARTRFAKSVLDAGWSTFRRLLRYKAIARGNSYCEVSERNTTQACSECGCLGGPKGRKGLVMRAWRCQQCGASHDRDVNAARNILTLGLGHQALARGAAAVAEMPTEERVMSLPLN